jgi:hypothetical protein
MDLLGWVGERTLERSVAAEKQVLADLNIEET